MSAIHNIWEAILHSLKIWDDITLQGKRLIEVKAKFEDIEECLVQMVRAI